MNPRSTDCEADALTTTPSRRYSHVKKLQLTFECVGPPADEEKTCLISFVPSFNSEYVYIGQTKQDLKSR